MAIPKTNSRRIQVEGRDYRWRVTLSIQECLGFWNGAKYQVQITLAVERYADPESRVIACIPGLLVRGFYDDQFYAPTDIHTAVPEPGELANLRGLTPLVITPSDVVSVIRAAHTQGWNPDAPGKPFVLKEVLAILSVPLQEEAPTELYEQDRARFWQEYHRAFGLEAEDGEADESEDNRDALGRPIIPTMRKVWSREQGQV